MAQAQPPANSVHPLTRHHFAILKQRLVLQRRLL